MGEGVDEVVLEPIELLEALVSAPELVFEPLALGDVLDEAVHAKGMPREIPEDLALRVHGPDAVWRLGEPELQVVARLPLQGRTHRRFDPVAVVRVDALQEVLERGGPACGVLARDEVVPLAPGDAPRLDFPLPAAELRDALGLDEPALAIAQHLVELRQLSGAGLDHLLEVVGVALELVGHLVEGLPEQPDLVAAARLGAGIQLAVLPGQGGRLQAGDGP
ncbi:hypothetical protein D3C86_1083520 [compost metagenome]